MVSHNPNSRRFKYSYPKAYHSVAIDSLDDDGNNVTSFVDVDKFNPIDKSLRAEMFSVKSLSSAGLPLGDFNSSYVSPSLDSAFASASSAFENLSNSLNSSNNVEGNTSENN